MYGTRDCNCLREVGVNPRPRFKGGWEVYVRNGRTQVWSCASSKEPPIGDGSIKACVEYANTVMRSMMSRSNEETVGKPEKDEELDLGEGREADSANELGNSDKEAPSAPGSDTEDQEGENEKRPGEWREEDHWEGN